MKLWRIHFDVTVQEHGKDPERHKRCMLVAAEDEDTAETIARPHATRFNFGPRVLAVDWRQTSSVSLPLDLSAMFGGTPERVFKPDAPGVKGTPDVSDLMELVRKYGLAESDRNDAEALVQLNAIEACAERIAGVAPSGAFLVAQCCDGWVRLGEQCERCGCVAGVKGDGNG